MSINVIYITSQGHSGSTLLTLLLGGHSEIFAIGEANAFSEQRRIARYQKFLKAQQNRTIKKSQIYESHLEKNCMCGAASVKVCPVWSKINSHLLNNYQLSLESLDVNHPDDEIFNNHNLALFKSIAAVAGVSYVVDAAKEFKRMKRLQCIDELKVRPIHLRRSAHGYVYSGVKRKLPWWKYIRSYTLREIERNLFLAQKDHYFLQYESMALHANYTTQSIMQWLDLPFDPNQMNWSENKQHLIAGNHMRFNNSAAIRLDEKWKKSLPLYLKVIISILTIPVYLSKNKQGHHTRHYSSH